MFKHALALVSLVVLPCFAGADSGQFVRIELPGDDRWLTLAEVEVISGGKNVARTGTATQSSTAAGGVATRAVDGGTSPLYGHNKQSNTSKQANPWWEVDLGKVVSIDTVKIWNRNEAHLASRLEGFAIRILDADRKEVFARADVPAPVDIVCVEIKKDGQLLYTDRNGKMVPAPLDATVDGKRLLETWKKEHYEFTDETYAAYMNYEKERTLKYLKVANGIVFPDDFLEWIDSDVTVQATVYGSRASAADKIIRVLRSLDLDLGKENVREKYTQLALTMAMTNQDEAETVDLKDRQPLELVIPKGPTPVDTNDPNRKLDLNDHIINFLSSPGVAVESTRKVYPKKWVEFANVTDPDKPKGEYVPDLSKPAEIIRTVHRPRYAYEVIGNKVYVDKFNAYMKDKGQKVRMEMTSPAVHGRAKNGPDKTKMIKYGHMFGNAYALKGLKPKVERGATPTIAEWCAYLIRNDKYKFPAGTNRQWPLFPLNAPWPVTTYLGNKKIWIPLREADDLWQQYKKSGKIHRGTNYSKMDSNLSLVRLMAPRPFGSRSVHMAVLRGGVCGTQARIARDGQVALGVPAVTAGQARHCAYVAFNYNPGNKTYGLTPGSYLTAGHEFTYPKVTWPLGGTLKRCLTAADSHVLTAATVNLGFEGYLKSAAAHKFYESLPDPERLDHGATLAASGLKLSPANLMLAEAAFKDADSAEEVFHLQKTLVSAMEDARKKPNAYPALVNKRTYPLFLEKISSVPLPEDKDLTTEICNYLRPRGSTRPILFKYRAVVEGVDGLVAATEAELIKHLASLRTPQSCGTMAAKLSLAIGQITDPKQKMEAVRKWHTIIVGKEAYINTTHRMAADPSAQYLYTQAKAEWPGNIPFTQSLLDDLTRRVKADCKQADPPAHISNLISSHIRSTLTQIKDKEQREAWKKELFAIMAGVKRYNPLVEKDGWKIVSCSYENHKGARIIDRGYAWHAIDGNTETVWSTYAEPRRGGVEEIVIDMGEIRKIKGFSYTPKGHRHGVVTHGDFHTSIDGKSWQLAVKAVLPRRGDSKPRTAPCKPRKARYFRFRPYGGFEYHRKRGQWFTVAELGVVEDIPGNQQ